MAAENHCVLKEKFYEELEKLKQSQKRNSSQTTLFLDDELYREIKEYLKESSVEEEKTILAPSKKKILQRKKWILEDESLRTQEGKTVISKSQIYDTLILAHKRTAHRGRQITYKWINENFSEVNCRVVNLFVGLCAIHESKKTITSHVKVVTKPLESPNFLNLIEIDLMDFRNCKCSCPRPHQWAMNIIDHHTKFVTVVPLHNKTADEVVMQLKEFCFTYGFPKKIILDNGREFRNQNLEMFCKENRIKLSHGAPRTPTTQGLTERSNRSWKEDMRSLIISTTNKKIKRWCAYTREASYTRNISYHRAIKMTPYEAVFNTKPHREIIREQAEEIIESEQHGTPETVQQQAQGTAEQEDKNTQHQRELIRESAGEILEREQHDTPETSTHGNQDLSSEEEDQDTQQDIVMPEKRQKIIENQRKYNTQMIKQTERRMQAKKKKYKISDMVAVKIDRVDKKSPLHPNMLLGKITAIEDTGCVKIVTEFGVVKTLISESRLTPCTSTNVKLNYDNEISFTFACKQASGL